MDNKSLIQNLINIRTKRGDIVPFEFNVAQSYYWAKKRSRNITLKARQKGLSKVIDADQLIECIRKFCNAVVVSHEKEATKRLFQAVRFYVDNMNYQPLISTDSATEIGFPKRGSSYYVGTAGQKAFGRGDTIHRAHLSEAAFYDNLEKILAGIEEAVGMRGQIDIETTPNGQGEFHDMWKKAKSGQSSYTPIFIPWFIDDEYSVDSLTDEDRKKMSDNIQRLISLPDAEFMSNIGEGEKILMRKAKIDWGIDITPGQMKWRTYKIWDKGKIFFQEYPEDDVSCFLQTGRSVFSKITVDISQRIPLDKPERITDEQKKELKNGEVFAGIDGAEGTLDGDCHVFAAILVQPRKRSRVIFEYASNEPIDVFWHKIHKIIKRYDMILGIEKNGVGKAHCLKAEEHDVEYEEWTTTGKGEANRSVMITDLEEAYRKEYLIETYQEAEEEALGMKYSESNRADHEKNKHDDRVFARAIAWQMAKSPTPSAGWL